MKKEFKYFSIFNHESEEEYLRSQHQHGWEFVKVTGIGMYHFQECEPEDVIYQLDYNQDTNNKEEYIKMFIDCGWEYIQEYAQFSYFRKPVSEMVEDERIFSDETSRLEMLERVYKGRLLPVLVIFSACLLPQFFINLSNGRYFLAMMFAGILAIYIMLFVYCAYHYYRKKNQR